MCSPKPVNLKYCAPVNLRWVHRAVCTTKYTHSTMCTRLAVGAQCNVYYTGTHSTLCAQNWRLIHSPMCTTNYTMCSITHIKNMCIDLAVGAQCNVHYKIHTHYVHKTGGWYATHKSLRRAPYFHSSMTNMQRKSEQTKSL